MRLRLGRLPCCARLLLAARALGWWRGCRVLAQSEFEWALSFGATAQALGAALPIPRCIRMIGKTLDPCFTSQSVPKTLTIPPELQSSRIGHFVEWNGSLYQRQEYTLQPTSVEPQRIRAMLELADCLSRVLHHQTCHSDQRLHQAQYELNELYDDFMATYGHLNSSANQAALGTDPRYFGLMSLEVKTGSGWGKADIFTKRTAKPYEAPERVEDPEEALIHCLNTLGRVDLEWIALRCR